MDKPQPAKLSAADLRAPEPRPTAIPAPSILLLGAPGSGKTYSLPTSIVNSSRELFVLVTEPNGVDSLVDSVRAHDLPIERVHWHLVSPAAPKWSALTEMANKVSALGQEDLARLKSGIGKRETQQFTRILAAVADFPDDRTGETFGDVTEWDPEGRVFAIDSLSGLSTMALDLAVGYKPTPHQGEWGIAMNLLDKLILSLTASLRCMFILTAHIDREYNELTGSVQNMPSVLGRKLAPKLPRFFSEVVLAKRDGDKFLWSTAEKDADLKNRALPISSSLPPTFEPIAAKYAERLADSRQQTAASR